MSDFLRVPSHLILEAGKLVEKKDHRVEAKPPQTIHYTHTIRMLPDFCDHGSELDFFQRMFRSELAKKDMQIEELRKMLMEKENYVIDKVQHFRKIEQLQPQYEGYLLPSEGSKFDFSRIQLNSQSQVTLSMNESNLSQRRTSDFQTLFPENERVNNQVLKVKSGMKDTMDALSNITNLLEKPRRKYQFYNTVLEKEQEIEEIHDYKRLDDTNLHISEFNGFSNTFNSAEQCPKIVRCEELESYDDDDEFDRTVEEEDSIDTASFLEETVKDHEILKQTLIELEQSTKQEIEDMKNYYESEIQAYIEILSQEKSRESKFNLNSTRSNIESQSEQKKPAIFCEDSDQPFQWNRSQKFEIIFPEQNMLTPSLFNE